MTGQLAGLIRVAKNRWDGPVIVSRDTVHRKHWTLMES